MRPCSVCLHARIHEIAADIVAGVSDVQIAQRYSLSRSAVQRHHAHVGGRPPQMNASDAAQLRGRAFQALASLPSKDEVGGAYASIAGRIDAIAAKAETEGSLAVALVGLRELRQTVTAQAALAGHIGGAREVQVNTRVNVDLGAAVKEIAALLRPPVDAAIPAELAVHLEAAPPDAGALARLEAILDAE